MKFNSRLHRTSNYKELIDEYYTIATNSYRQVWGDFFHPAIFESDSDDIITAFKKTHARFLRDAKIQDHASIIDLGCGIGSFAQFLALHSKTQVTGLELNQLQLELATKLAEQKKIENLHFMQGDVMDLKGLPEKYDAAFLIDVGSHLPDKKKALQQIHHILEPGSRLIITDWLQKESPSYAENKYLLEPFNNYWHFPYLESLDGYIKIAQQTGFNIVVAQDISEQTAKNWQLFYDVALSVVNKRSIGDLTAYVKNPLSLLKQKSRDIYEAQFYGNIYTKICYDAGVFKYGYFVLEKK